LVPILYTKGTGALSMCREVSILPWTFKKTYPPGWAVLPHHILGWLRIKESLGAVGFRALVLGGRPTLKRIDL